MPAAQYDILIEKGSVFTLSFVYKSGGVEVNLTGWKARMKVRPDYAKPEISQMSATTENGGITLGARSVGSVDVKIGSTQTELVVLKQKGVWDFEFVPPSGEDDAFRLLHGKAVLSPEVTY